METIKSLNEKLKKLQAESNEVKSDLESRLQVEYNKIFEDNVYLRTVIGDLNRSNEYGMQDHEVYAWTRFYGSKFEDCRQYLENWLEEQDCIRVDWENDALLLMKGHSLIINSEGVYDQDSQKFVVEAFQYTVEGQEDTALRNQLIEAWMKDTGYFPGVFKVDYCGNVFPVDTTKS